ncbi:MAG: signal peptidase II [Planctomycetota bacterium]
MFSKKTALFLILAGIVLALDLGSKACVFSWLDQPFDRHEVIDGVFEIIHHTNTGGMWGVGQEWNPWILKVVRMAAVLVIFVILKQTPASDRWSVAALGLVLGGAAGNIYDSWVHEAVRDFLKFDFGFWIFDPFPTFNIADSAICVGVALLALRMVFCSPPQAKSNRNASAGEAGS